MFACIPIAGFFESSISAHCASISQICLETPSGSHAALGSGYGYFHKNVSVAQDFYCKYHPMHHWILDICPFKTTVTIEDGSAWNIDPDESSNVFSWKPGDIVFLMQNPIWAQSLDWPEYLMMNLKDQSGVCVDLSLGPMANNPRARFISAINFDGGAVQLTDGSCWMIAPEDLPLFRGWAVDDSIIAGKNESFFSKYKAILINPNMNHYIRALQY